MKWYIITSDYGKKIRPIQKYLLNKYVPDARPVWLDLKDKPIKDWCANLHNMIIEDEPTTHCVLLLDDHLILDRVTRSISMPREFERVELGRTNKNHAGCKTYSYRFLEYLDTTPYKVSTQPSIWRTEALLRVLREVSGTPWDFEVNGSCKAGIVREPVVTVLEESALSKKWKGVNLRGMKKEDVEYILEKGWITKDEIK